MEKQAGMEDDGPLLSIGELARRIGVERPGRWQVTTGHTSRHLR